MDRRRASSASRLAIEALQRLADTLDRSVQLHRKTAALLARAADPLRRAHAEAAAARANNVAGLIRQIRGTAAAMRRRGGSQPLTGRELEVVRLIVDGLTNREIAARLGIARRTVESHVENVYSKLHIHSRAQAVAWYLTTIGPPDTKPPGP